MQPYIEGDAGRYLDKERKDLSIGTCDIVDDLERSDVLDFRQGRVARGTLTLREEDERFGARVPRVVERDSRELALVYFSCNRASNDQPRNQRGLRKPHACDSRLTVDEGTQGGKLCARRGCGGEQSSASSNGIGSVHLV